MKRMKQHSLHVSMWCGMDQSRIKNVTDEWCECLRACVRVNGAHLEQLLLQYYHSSIIPQACISCYLL